jgi:hypothetical protein
VGKHSPAVRPAPTLQSIYLSMTSLLACVVFPTTKITLLWRSPLSPVFVFSCFFSPVSYARLATLRVDLSYKVLRFQYLDP